MERSAGRLGHCEESPLQDQRAAEPDNIPGNPDIFNINNALVDSGAAINLIDYHLVEKLRLPTRPRKTPLRVTAVDNQPIGEGLITHLIIPLTLQFGSLGYTIMGKTDDLTAVQKTIIDTLYKESKPQTFIAKEAGCSQSAVSKHVNGKLSGRKKCGRKRCTTNRENRSLMRIVKQNQFKNLSELHKEWTEAGVKASRATTHRRIKEFGYSYRIPLVKPLLNHRQRQRCLTWAKEKKNWTVAQWSKVLFSDESKFCISFGNQGPRVWRKGGEAHSPSCLKSNVKFPQSVMIWGAMSSAGVGPLCFLKTKVTAPVYQEILEHFMLPCADQLFEDADFIFQQDLAPAHTAKSIKCWLNDHGVGVLDWPANSPDLNPIENLWGIVKRKMRNKRPKNADELKATVKETWASIPPQQCHKLITSMPRRIEADFQMWLDALMAHTFPSFHHPKMKQTVNKRSYVMLHIITNVEVKWPGSVHDSRIYHESTLSNKLECGEIDGFLLGDKGYPCKPTLMTPYPEPEPGPQQRFNVAHCRTRAWAEMTIGLLKARFQCLRHLRVTPERACDIIVACIVLHNIAIFRGEQHPALQIQDP
ncbi:hypothetical protein QTP86_020666 [Hemibagrus guttatus]|nr:hypothetical protein QTP86_020666 [Hemibagrus guttatus]